MANYNGVVLLGRDPVRMECEGCGRTLETWRLDEHRGQLRPPTRGVSRSDVPDRAGLPQVIDYRCKGKDCRRQVVVGFPDVEAAVIRALREGANVIRVGIEVTGRSEGEPVQVSYGPKAPIPGGYRRRPHWPS